LARNVVETTFGADVDGSYCAVVPIAEDFSIKDVLVCGMVDVSSSILVVSEMIQ
jgi:hypothetical protein